MAWEMFDRDGAGGFQICGVDGDALERAPLAELPVACEITIQAESAAPVALESTERDLERVSASIGASIVATARTRTELWMLAYLPNDDDADKYTTVALPRRASISVAPAIDPDWTLFDRARPVGIEEQSMLDFKVRAQLHEVGDLGGERPIEHVVDGLADDAVVDFAAAVRSAIPGARCETQTDHGDARRVTHIADPKNVTESSWIIRQIAERFGGVYDGWGCPVVRAPEPEPKRKRRWFR